MVFEELLIVLLQFIFELLVDLVLWFPWDALLWRREVSREPRDRISDAWLTR